MIKAIKRKRFCLGKLATVILGISLILITSSCIHNPRLETTNALERLREIRNAEENYFKSFGGGSYGTLHDLAEADLISNSIVEGVDWGYHFDLRVNGARYTVNANPLMEGSNERMGNCFFMDETGVIRASNKDFTPADEFSEPIRNQ